MGIKPTYISIGSLFHHEYVFRVPRYQRGYSWEDAEVEDFVRDLRMCYEARTADSAREHFLGGIVSVEKRVSGSAGCRYCDLIDGQQRIATVVLLASCLRSSYLALEKEANQEEDEENRELAKVRARRIEQRYLTYEDEIDRKLELRDRLELSNPDKSYFAQLIHGRRPQPKGDRESHDRLFAATQNIQSSLDELVDRQKSRSKRLDTLAVFEEILLSDFTVIHIVTDQEDEAYRLFQVLNDRGTNLTEGDLLRAATLELLGKQGFEQQHDMAAEMWDEILQDPSDLTEKFLRWYFASITGARPGQAALFDDFFEEFFPQHKRAITSASAKAIVNAVEELRDEVRLCRLLADGEWPYRRGGKAASWDKERLRVLLGELKHHHCMPLLLASCKLRESEFVKVIDVVERFFFRFKLICNRHIGSLTKIYHRHSTNIRQNPAKYRASRLQKDLRELQHEKADDDLFGTLLEKKLTFQPGGGNKPLKYFFIRMEDYMRWYKEGASGSPKCRDTSRVQEFVGTTIEHVYPQNAEGSTKDEALEPLLHVLGNLTILGEDDNEVVANADFERKKAFLKESALLLNRNIADTRKWTRKAVRDRQKILRDAAIKVFTMG